MTPRRLAARAAFLLLAAGNTRNEAQARTYFRENEKVRFYGVATPRLREIERILFRSLQGDWGVEKAAAFCGLMVRSEFNEAKTLGLLFLSRYRKSFPRNLFHLARSWLLNLHCDNWSATDALCGWIIAPLLRDYPDLVRKLKDWARSRTLWLRRASLVSLVPLARRGERLAAAYTNARALLGDEEDLIHKATGWLMREAGKTDSRRLEAFILRHGPRIPRTALRYSIERFPEGRRREILRATRPRRL